MAMLRGVEVGKILRTEADVIEHSYPELHRRLMVDKAIGNKSVGQTNFVAETTKLIVESPKSTVEPVKPVEPEAEPITASELVADIKPVQESDPLKSKFKSKKQKKLESAGVSINENGGALSIGIGSGSGAVGTNDSENERVTVDNSDSFDPSGS